MQQSAVSEVRQERGACKTFTSNNFTLSHRFNFDQLDSMDKDNWIMFECRFCNEDGLATKDDVIESDGNETNAQMAQRYAQNIFKFWIMNHAQCTLPTNSSHYFETIF